MTQLDLFKNDCRASSCTVEAVVRPLRVLVACESSGTVRDAFNALGHVATSCDLLESETPGDHYAGDVKDILGNGWDIIIAHPPCTYLNVAAAWAFQDPDYDKFPGVGYHQKVKHGTLVGEARRKAQAESLAFVRLFMDADCLRIAIENPVGAISTNIRKADQYIHPHQFGDDASKTTGLWLKGLPNLQSTANVPPRMVDGKPRWANQCDNGQNKLTPSPDRWRERSKTYQGIADAMALQWGGDTGWRRVSFAADCDGCECPGPTQDGMEYETFHGVLMARPILGANAQISRGTPSAESDCSTLTRCEICKRDCGTMAGLIVHVRKFHPSSDNESTRKGLT